MSRRSPVSRRGPVTVSRRRPAARSSDEAAGRRETPPALDQAVLAAVRLIPPGRVMTYGDVAEYVGTRAARNVGRILAGSGEVDDGLCWHRVVRADGSCAEHIRAEQTQRLRAEGVPFLRGRVDLRRARWDGAPPAAPGPRISVVTVTDGVDPDRVETRARLLPEETAAGDSADPAAQAAAILEDSDRRTADPEQTKHESVQSPD
jgi:methylated-DNA-protein-cysteine methyltransferase-like protein